MIGDQVKAHEEDHDLAYTGSWLQAVGFCLLHKVEQGEDRVLENPAGP